MTKLYEYTAVGRYYKVYNGGEYVSQHTTEREAIERANQLKLDNPDSDVFYIHDYEVTVGLTDAGVTIAQDYGQQVDQPPIVATTPAPSFTVGTPNVYQMSQHITDDGLSTVTYSLSNTLPNGLTFNSSTGALTYDGLGQASVSSHQLTATDSAGSDVSDLFNIGISSNEYAAFPRLAALEGLAWRGMDSTVTAGTGIATGTLLIGTMFEGQSAAVRLATRGPSQQPMYDTRYSASMFNGTKIGLQYDNTWQASTGYIVGEMVCSGNDVFMCTVAGTSGGTEPTWNTAALENTTTDNTVTWAYAYNQEGRAQPFTFPSGTYDWDTFSDNVNDEKAHNAYFLNNLTNSDVYFYDPAAWILKWRERIISRGEGTQADYDIMSHAASYMLDHEYTRKVDGGGVNPAGQYLGDSGFVVPYPNTSDQLYDVTEGWYQDINASGTRYKSRGGLFSATDLQGLATTGAFSGRGGGPDLTNPLVEVEFTGQSWPDGTIFSESQTLERFHRPMFFQFMRRIFYTRARWERDGGSLPVWTIRTNDTTPTIPTGTVWAVPHIMYLLNKMAGTMNGDYDNEVTNPDTWAPFFFGITGKAFLEYIKLMREAGLDENDYYQDTDVSTACAANYSKTTTHGSSSACQAWPTIGAALQDFFYWMRETAVSVDANPMWDTTTKSFLQRANSTTYNSGKLDILIAPIYYYIAQMLKDGETNVTAYSADDWVAAADEMIEGACDDFAWFSVGKQLNELMAYTTDCIDLRNTYTGRND